MRGPRYTAAVECCPACLASCTTTTPTCPTCADDYRAIELTADATDYSPARIGRRSGMDRFPDPDEPAEFSDVTVTRSDTGAEVDLDDLPESTRDELLDGLLTQAEEDDSAQCRDEDRADARREGGW